VNNLAGINRLLAETQRELAKLNARREELLSQLAELQREKALLLDGPEAPPQSRSPSVTNQSSPEAKIALFRSLFRGREDVYARRFVATNGSVASAKSPGGGAMTASIATFCPSQTMW
jgi:hypothetical protein